MPLYFYEAIDNAGKRKTDFFEAVNEWALVEKLHSEGYFVVSVRLTKTKAAPKVNKKGAPLRFDHDRCKIEDLLVFSRQLATMLEAGVPMLRSMEVILSQIQSKELFTAASQAHDQIQQGSSLSAALVRHPKIFNQFWVSLAEVGEASGTMPLVLNKLADHVEQQAAFRSAIISAMIYPLILFVVCIGAVLFFALVVGPRFEAIFKSMHADLPVMTRCLLATFNFIKHNLLHFAAGIFIFFVVARVYMATPPGRLQFEKLVFSLPVFGEITKLVIIERFAAQMSILIESGVPILYALEITEKMVDNKTCGLMIVQVRDGVRQGKGMADALVQQPFFPMMVVQMVKVGEETGELGKMLKHVAQYYQDNVQAFLKRFGTLIEPFMLVFMAAIIGTIVVSIFMPLFKMGQGFHTH